MTTASKAAEAAAEPARDCPLCPRLVAYRMANAAAEPGWFNGPAPSFGPSAARLLVVGLAPGRTGANRTGRPFTGDFAGELLYATLTRHGWGRGMFRADPADGFVLVDAMVSNAVRCAPPENRPLPAEIATCNGFLAARMRALPRLAAIVALGRIAHEAVLRARGLRPAAHPFAHGARHQVDGVTLFDSYHCSRYNQNTRRLTPEAFDAVFAAVRAHLGPPSPSPDV
jgi:uracil-DNA glycosylase family 4